MQNKNSKSSPDKNDQQKENKKISTAHEAAEHDIEQDPDLSEKPKPGDDLDEGELARLEGEQ